MRNSTTTLHVLIALVQLLQFNSLRNSFRQTGCDVDLHSQLVLAATYESYRLVSFDCLTIHSFFTGCELNNVSETLISDSLLSKHSLEDP